MDLVVTWMDGVTDLHDVTGLLGYDRLVEEALEPREPL